MDISKIKGSAADPDDYERRLREAVMGNEAHRKEEARRHVTGLAEQMRASVEKEAQIDRIESKLDQILDMLNRSR